MTVIRICEYFLKTNLNTYDAKEAIENALIKVVEENGRDFPFSLDDFIDEFIEENSNYEIIEDSHEWNVEFSPEDIDEIIDNVADNEEEACIDDEDEYDELESDEE